MRCNACGTEKDVTVDTETTRLSFCPRCLKKIKARRKAECCP
jgi:hypothetical protein